MRNRTNILFWRCLIKSEEQIKRILLCFCLLVLTLTPVMAQEERTKDLVQLQVVGEALIKDHNLPAARDLAVTDGLNKAVEQVVGTLVYSETQVENYQLLKDSIRLRSAGYVTGYEIIDTWTEFDLYKVLLSVKVRKGMIIKDLDELRVVLQMAGDPRVMVVITEREPSKRLPVQIVETEIISGLVQAGYQVVNYHPTSREQFSRLYSQVRGKETKVVQQLAAEYQADLLVLGQASTAMLGKYYELISYRASLQTMVVKAETGEILTVHDIQETGVDLTEVVAAEKALSKVGREIASLLQNDLVTKLAVENIITVNVKNISYNDLLLVHKQLRETHLVSRVNLREFIEQSATLSVTTSLLAPQLAEYISGWQGCPVEIMRVSNNLIELMGR